MLYIPLAVFNALIWVAINIKWKKLRKEGVNPVSTLALLCGAIPFWVLVFVISVSIYNFTYNHRYLFFLLIWSVMVTLTNLGSLFLMRYRALSELSMYKLALSTLITLFLGVLFLHNFANSLQIIAVVLIFVAGFLVSNSRFKSEISLIDTLGILLFLSILGSVQFIVYKEGVLIQKNPLVHSMLAQLVVYPIFFIFSIPYLKKDMKRNLIQIKDFAYIGILVFIYTLIEAFLFKALPIVVLIALSVLPIIIYQFYDVFNKEIKLSWKLCLATIITATSLLILNLR